MFLLRKKGVFYFIIIVNSSFASKDEYDII